MVWKSRTRIRNVSKKIDRSEELKKAVAVSEESSSVPAGAANFPAAVFLAGKCPNLGRDSISRSRKIGKSFSSSVEICRKTFPAGNFGQPQPSRVFWIESAQTVKCKPWTERVAEKGLSRGVSRGGLNKAPKPWIRGKKGAQIVN